MSQKRLITSSWVQAFAAAIVTFACSSLNATEIVKWVDEKGKVHFGDKAPSGKENAVERIVLENAPTNKPEKTTQKNNQEYWLREQQRKEAQAEKLKAQASAKKSQKNTKPELSDEEKRSLCRDTFVSNVRKRTQCFKSISE